MDQEENIYRQGIPYVQNRLKLVEFEVATQMVRNTRRNSYEGDSLTPKNNPNKLLASNAVQSVAAFALVNFGRHTI